jgi:hypothetical protein
MIAWLLLLLSSGSFSEGHLEDSQKSLLPDSDETFFRGFPNINNFLFADLDDHVKSLNFSANDLSHPKGFVHKLFSSFDSDEVLALSEEEGQGSADILA